jgi:hypothetical protein
MKDTWNAVVRVASSAVELEKIRVTPIKIVIGGFTQNVKMTCVPSSVDLERLSVLVPEIAQIAIPSVKTFSVKIRWDQEIMAAEQIANVRKRNTSSAMTRSNVSKLMVEEETSVSLMLTAKVIHTQNVRKRCVSQKMDQGKTTVRSRKTVRVTNT